MEFPVVKLLLCDAAPQFNWVTEQLALCWIHEGRHYKKLDPSSAPFRSALTDFTKQFWEYYDQLLTYRFGPRTPDGATAWDTFMTLTATAKKLGVNIYHYIHDRVSGAFELPDLADTITQRAAEQSLGASWDLEHLFMCRIRPQSAATDMRIIGEAEQRPVLNTIRRLIRDLYRPSDKDS